ncbi:MAG: hypothetical protein HC819_15760 [Cyclobacteriaceae bacterium]|nr:hypothetical protein [Cyclobacteriaceae bacterium]
MIKRKHSYSGEGMRNKYRIVKTLPNIQMASCFLPNFTKLKGHSDLQLRHILISENMQLQHQKTIVLTLMILSIVLGNTSAIFAFNVNQQTQSMVHRTDSTQVKTEEEKGKSINEAREKAEKPRSTSRISYNIVYYLIAKFIMLNPFRRPA